MRMLLLEVSQTQHAQYLRRGEKPMCPRVYVGHPSCPKFLDDPDWIFSLEVNITLLVPPLTERWFSKFVSLYQQLQNNRDTFEVCANDYGTLRWVSGHTGTAVAGFLLARQETDPRLSDYLSGAHQPERTVYTPDGETVRLCHTVPPAPLVRHWRTPSCDAMALAFLGAERVELTAQTLPLPETMDVPHVTLWQGLAPLSVYPCRDCSHCGASTGCCLTFHQKKLQWDANLLFYSSCTAMIPDYVDRIVHYDALPE